MRDDYEDGHTSDDERDFGRAHCSQRVVLRCLKPADLERCLDEVAGQTHHAPDDAKGLEVAARVKDEVIGGEGGGE